MNIGNTAQGRVPGIRTELQGMVVHTLGHRDHLHGREAVTNIETIPRGNHVRGTALAPDHVKGIEAHHPLQEREKGIKADHALIQSEAKGGGTADLFQGKLITDHEHDHVQKPQAVTVTHTPEVIQGILFIANTGKDHEQDRDPILSLQTVTNIENLPKGNHGIDYDHDPNRDPLHGR